MKLASKIVLLCLLSMAAMSGLFSYFTIQRDAEYFAAQHSRNASELVEAIKPRIAEALKDGETDELAAAVQACSVEFRHISMRYVEFDNPQPSREPSAPKHLLGTVFEKEQLTVTVTDQDGIQKVLTYIPFSQDRSRGGLEVAKAMDDVETHTHETLWRTALTLAGAALLSAGIIVFGGVRMIGRPLQLLVDKTKRISTGDFTSPVEIKGGTELSQLGQALNEMCVQLAHQQETIENEASSRILAEQQLRHANRLETVGQLAAGVAHEMGTPLNVVSGRAALIAAGKLSDEEIKQSAQTIKAESDRITKIIRSLLDFARRDKPQRSLGNIKSIVEQSVDLLRNHAAKHNTSIETESQPTRFDADVDAGQIQQVFANLIMNAVQAIDGSGTINVRLSKEHAVPPTGVDANSGEHVRVDIIDSGSGISPEDQEHIFEPFFTTKDVGDGTGLGLSISYGIIRDHDGWIAVSSKPNEGSCFSVYIPAASPTKAS